MGSNTRGHWGSRFGFILAASGSAVGLGNIWKFPYVAGENGGGAFVLIYLFCIALIGVPIFIAELYIGQKSQANVIAAFDKLDKPKTFWRLPGWLGLISAFIILSFYSVVGGWILDFTVKAVTNQFAGQSETQIQSLLNQLFAAPALQLMWHTVIMTLTIGIVIGGVRNGLEKWSKILMPTLFVLLMALFIQSMFQDGFSQAMSFLFKPDTSHLTASGVLEAVGHSFFTLSLGMGAIMTYGSYLGPNESLPKIAITVALLDTFIALVAGIIIFSVTFSFGLEPGSGPGLIFSTLPTLFAQMNGGYIIAVMFFMLVSFAAITSAVSILETVVAYWSENHNHSRTKATLTAGAMIYLVGLLTVFSTNIMSDVKIFGLTFFDLFDKLSANYLLPAGGLFISLFYGWKLGPEAVEKTLGANAPQFLKLGLLWSARVVSPVAIFLVIINLVIGF